MQHIAWMFLIALTQQGMGRNVPHKNFNNMKNLHWMKDLTDEQRSKIFEIKYRYDKKIIPLTGEKKSLQVDLRYLLAKDNPDIKEIEKLVNKIASVSAKIRLERIKMQLEIRKIAPNAFIHMYNRGKRNKK